MEAVCVVLIYSILESVRLWLGYRERIANRRQAIESAKHLEF